MTDNFFSDEGITNQTVTLAMVIKYEATGEVRVGVSEEFSFQVFFFLLFRKQTTAFVQTHAVLTTTKLWNKLPSTL